jgi:pimeloyl-ACP methyl ester carboxylesterase
MGQIAATGAVASLLVVLGLALCTVWIARQARRLAPPIGRFIEVDGVILHYLDRGAGPALVLVHGLGGNLRNFHRLIEALSPTCRVIAVDRPESGYSKVRWGEHPKLRSQARIIARFIEKLELDRPVVVGHSLGGTLALALALDHPQRVRRLVLISALSQVERTPPALFNALNIHSSSLRWLIAWTLMAPVGWISHCQTLSALFAPELVPDSFDRESGGALGLRPASFIAASKDMVTVIDELECLVARYPTLAVPVDIIFGLQDPILDYRIHAEKLAAALPEATLHLIEGGHMIPVTAAATVAAVVNEAAQGRDHRQRT